jgi:hypothetical protein
MESIRQKLIKRQKQYAEQEIYDDSNESSDDGSIQMGQGKSAGVRDFLDMESDDEE